jgi:hypothetical protein
MKLKPEFPVMALLTLCSASAEAQEMGAWSLGQSRAENGAIIHMATLTSSTLIASATDYAALYSITCQTGEPMKWAQQLRLEDSLSSRGEIELVATIDKKLPREEFWTVAKTSASSPAKTSSTSPNSAPPNL